MDLIEDLDPEEARAIVDPALKLMMEAVQRYGGYVAQSTGDGIFALFGAPVAHEDHPQRALFAALRMQSELRRYADKLRAEKGVNLQVRVGANTGEVVVREIRTGGKHTEYSPIGHSTGVAARLEALAAPGSIAISESVRKLVEGYFALKSLGPARIKGISEPLEIYEVTGVGTLRTRLQRAAARGYTKFVGRQREMEMMEHAAELTKAGHGQIVAAVAEAGVGKSRLFHEFKARNQFGWMVLEGFSVSHGKASAYQPVIDLLHSYFRVAPEDDTRTRREKVNGKVLTLDRRLEDAVPYLFGLLGLTEGDDPLAGMDARIRRLRTLEALKRVLLRESVNQPMMVVFEDLHWIEGETEAFLNLLADSIAAAKILLLVNYRPEYQHQWGSKSYSTQLRLDPLGKESGDRMLAAMLGEGNDLIPLKNLIITRTEGNPFFMEETVQTLFDEGALIRDQGMVKVTKSLNQLKIPLSVQGILAARIDRLPTDEKDLLQTLAVIGTELPLGLVREVTKRTDDELNPMLEYLQVAEFIYEQPAITDVEYTFKHALTHDVAYNSVLIERRRLLHERIGAAIELRYHERLDDYLAELAHHYVHSTNTRKAVEFMHMAGRQAGKRLVSSEAISRLEAALELVKILPDGDERCRKELALCIDLGLSLFAWKGYAAPQAESVYSLALELARRVGDDTDLCRALLGLQASVLFRGELEQARRLGEEALEVAHRTGRAALIVEGHRALGHALRDLGEYSSARTHNEAAIAMPTPDSAAPSAKTTATWTVATILFDVGYPDQAERKFTEAIELARKGRLPTLCTGLVIWADHYLSFGRPQRALECADEALALSAEHGFRFSAAEAMLTRGRALVALGRVEEGLEQIQQGVAAYAANNWVLREFLFLELPIALWRARRPEEGLKVVDSGLADVRVTCCPADEADLHRLRGEFLLMREPADKYEAERCFLRALQISRRIDAKWLQLLATTSLARLLRETNRREEALTILAEIYNWFTEGFDTADLKDAKALLDELSN
jgi:class 3 adenylate cyclase/tetratricopeptide (TPR) repeat protein